MILFKKSRDLGTFLANQRQNGKSIGFVPTMGALHQGHLALVRSSIDENAYTACSIFVNPTQFNDPRDYKKYPFMIEKDIDLLEKLDCSVLFQPSVDEVYPDGIVARKHFDLGYLDNILEGKCRPGHFQGVCMVMQRLLELVSPDRLYLGQKDYQQCLVIKRLITLMGREDSTQVMICPTQREGDGLAMSSRNLRLSDTERAKAATIYRSLKMINENYSTADLGELKRKAAAMLEENGFKIDYIEIATAKDLHTADHWDGKEKLVALVAAFLNDVRLIDNLVLS